MTAQQAGFDLGGFLKTLTKIVAIIGSALAALNAAIEAARD